MRYVRAFFVALWLTLRGRQTEASPHAPLEAWIARSAELSKAVIKVADATGMKQAIRQQAKLKLEGREQSMESILATVQYHAEQEYPYLLENFTDHSITAIYAANMNDQFSVSRLQEADFMADDALKQAISRLNEHLSSIPATNP